jgi:hypothetical protein
MRPDPSIVRAGLFLILSLSLASPSEAVVAKGGDPLATETYDIRVFGGAALDQVEQAYDSPRLATAAAMKRDLANSLAIATERLRSLSPGARVEPSPLSTGIEVVASAGTPLTPAAPGLEGAEVVRSFLRAWPGLYGLSSEQVDHLEVLSESRQDGFTLVRLRQTVNGRPVFQSDTRAVLDRDGRLLHTVGRLIPGIDEVTVPVEWRISSREALRVALASVGSGVDLVTRPATSAQVYFSLGPSVVVPAWAHVAFTRGPADWYTVVDARTGTLLWRKNIRYNLAAQTADTICAEVYVQPDGQTPADSPAPDSVLGSRTADINLDAALTNHELTNRNVVAFLDRNGDDSPDTKFPLAMARRGKRKTQAICSTKIPFSSATPPADLPTAAPEEYSSGAVAELFYLVNWFHDRLSDLGFNKDARNFEDDDPVLAEAQYAADAGIFNLASFSSPPDGSPGFLRMSVWNGPEPDRDASLDAQIAFHELTHGVTSRLIGNGACLNWYPGRALAEGWSDFYALALLNGMESDAPDGIYSIGGYTANKLGGHTDFTNNYLFGLRRFPYSTQMSVNPLTWKDADDTTSCSNDRSCVAPDPMDPTKTVKPDQSSLEWELEGANEVHNAGELWALSLWEVRKLIINAKTQDNPLTAIHEGNEVMLKLVTKALMRTTCDPSFTDARNALLAAACPTPDTENTCQYEPAIWQGFAKRGLGYSAHDSGGIATHYGIQEAFDSPILGIGSVTISSKNGTTYFVQGETAELTISLINPWRSKRIRATAGLTCDSTQTMNMYNVPPKNTLPTGSDILTATFPIDAVTANTDEAFGCSLKLWISSNPQTDPPDNQIDLGLRVGFRNGVIQPPSTYTWNRTVVSPGEGISYNEVSCRNILDDGKILDGDLRGRCFTLEVTDDFVVDSVALQIDDLTDPHVGDLTVLLKGPNGYGTELIYRLAREVVPGFSLLGANELQCLQGARVQEGGEDFLGATGLSNNTCFAGEWSPVLESTRWLKSTTGQLDRFRGISSKGPWTLFITDAVPDGGPQFDSNNNLIPLQLNSWTLTLHRAANAL